MNEQYNKQAELRLKETFQNKNFWLEILSRHPSINIFKDLSPSTKETLANKMTTIYWPTLTKAKKQRNEKIVLLLLGTAAFLHLRSPHRTSEDYLYLKEIIPRYTWWLRLETSIIYNSMSNKTFLFFLEKKVNDPLLVKTPESIREILIIHSTKVQHHPSCIPPHLYKTFHHFSLHYIVDEWLGLFKNNLCERMDALYFFQSSSEILVGVNRSKEGSKKIGKEMMRTLTESFLITFPLDTKYLYHQTEKIKIDQFYFQMKRGQCTAAVQVREHVIHAALKKYGDFLRGKPTHRAGFIHLSDQDIFNRYMKELCYLQQRYAQVDNKTIFKRVSYFLTVSYLRTVSFKHKRSVKKTLSLLDSSVKKIQFTKSFHS